MLKGKSGDVSDSAKTLASVLSKCISPTGLMTAAVLAGVTAFVIYEQKIKESVKTAQNYHDEILKMKDSTTETYKAIDESAGSELAHIERIQHLKDELKDIVDENGKVKSGYEERASFILNELNEALGTEYKMNGDIIDSYKDLQENIDKTIAKKKADIVLAAKAKKWEEANNAQSDALIKQNDAYHKLQDIAKEYGTSVDGLNGKVNEFYSQISDYDDKISKATSGGERTYYLMEKNKIQAKIDTIREYQQAYSDATDIVKYNVQVMQEYDDALVDYTEGNYEKLYTNVKQVKDYTDSTLSELTKSLANSQLEYDDYSRSVETTNDKLAADRKKNAENDIKAIADQLRTRTSTVNQLSQDEINAWQQLAKNSFDVYVTELSQMDSTTAQKIMKATGIVATDEQLSTAFKNLGQEAMQKFSDNDFESIGKKAADRISSGMTLKDILKKSGLATQFTFAADGSHADGLAYVPYNGYIARLHEGERVLTKAENREYVANNITNKAGNNVVVNFYAQQISDSDLTRIEQKINRDWGRAY